MYLIAKAKRSIEKQVDKALKKLGLPMVRISVSRPNLKVHGDLSLNTALILAKQTKTSPQAISQKIIDEIKPGLADLFHEIKPVGGFINFYFKPEAYLQELATIVKLGGRYGSRPVKQKRVLIDYSSPNIAKSFSIGHLSSTLIGQALANVYQFLGWQVIADNHLGDWGTQFGMIIAAVERKKLDIKKLTILDLERLYVEYNRDIDKDPDLKETARLAFVRLEQGEPQAKYIWSQAVKVSMAEFDELYQKLATLNYSPIVSKEINKQNPIKYLAYGESHYQPILDKTIELLKQKKIARQDKGALIVEFDNLPPAIVVKSDGGTTYFTRDLATVWYRQNQPELKSDLYIYEVGGEQSLYFKQLFAIVARLGWLKKDQMIHVAHGMISLPEGKMSTRRGRTIKVGDLIDKLIQESVNLLQDSALSQAEKEKLSRAVGVGALKFNQLKKSPATSFVFKWDEVLNLEANSGPYLQYTHARCQSVLTKAGFKSEFRSVTNVDVNKEELDLLRQLSKVPAQLELVIDQSAPNLLAGYLLDLAACYNLFYNRHRILNAKGGKRKLRLLLTQATAIVIRTGLGLLGITAPDKM